ncbi:HAMP domain-containing histidine kinase [Flavobacteriaceae bacterium]|nr:HAMP domain-containing histidine kinase [Flavobacteriaceae bacterium]MDC1320927.1 HAMP domain-containing histidine kinase [Flavobacteriaceae bacterium]
MNKKNNISSWILVSLSLIVISVILWNTFLFFQKFKTEERSKMQIWSLAQAELTRSSEDDNISNLTLEVLKNNSSTPMIKVNKKGEIEFNNIDNLKIDDTTKINQLIRKFKNENTPIKIYYDNKVIETLYYGNSDIINKLKYYPLALILIILLFISLVYFYYKSSKIATLNMLWTGMAKETAHQIGTPLTSLMGWVEILKSKKIDSNYLIEIEKDIDRLNVISERFNKIGSKPILLRTNLTKLTKDSINYLITRVSNRVKIELKFPKKQLYCLINDQLYSWTIENIIKNSIDAIKGDGDILVQLTEQKKILELTITDNGTGIKKSQFKKIFNPGYTSKMRGWGLGLSLSKRIIEDYHNGKIFIKHSELNVGTTIQIEFDKE